MGAAETRAVPEQELGIGVMVTLALTTRLVNISPVVIPVISFRAELQASRAG